MPRGGRRQGKPGVAHGNRTDLNAPKPPAQAQFTGQQYGQRTQQTQAQQAVPVAAPAGPEPGAMGDFTRPTERPNEPMTAGLPMGPGPGPEVLPQAVSTAGDELRALFSRFPSPELRELIEELDEEQRGAR